MEKYISKSALVAEIEREKEKCGIFYDIALSNNAELAKVAIEEQERQYNSLLSFIDTLEVKEVDLEEELIKWHKQHFKKDGTFIGMSGFYLTNNSQMDIAKHFFELGMLVNNPITATDRGMVEEIIVNLKRVEQDYRINLTKEIEWLRNKVKKGE